MTSHLSVSVLILCVLQLIVVAVSAEPLDAFQLAGEGNSALRLDNPRSGEVCSSDGEPTHVCSSGPDINVLGREMCDWSEDVKYPCTRYGYEFDYAGANPGDIINCEVTRSVRTVFGPDTEQVTGENTAEYTEELQSEKGRLFHHGFQTYAPVEDRVLVYESHRCAHLGEPLFQVNFVHRFEPE